jgi:AcrR family transcriptional regulator
MVRPKMLENRAEQIIAAADELFARYGYERTCIEDIAKHLGISKGSVYLDFKTKQDILIQILRRHAQMIIGHMEKRLSNIKGSPLQALKDALEETVLVVYDKVSSDIHTPEALLHTSLEMKKSYCSDFGPRKRDLLVGFLQKAAAAGEINEAIANEETAMVIKMGTATLFPPYIEATEPGIPLTREILQANARRLVSLLIDGLRKYKS